MKLVTFAVPNGPARLGALRDDELIDLTTTTGVVDMLSLIRSGEPGLERARAALDRADDSARQPGGGARLLAPLPVPEQVRCFASFEEHGRNSAKVMIKKMAALAADPAAEEARLLASGNFNAPAVWYERPLYYKGNRFNWVGPDVEITWPEYSITPDYELELACIIGRGGRDIAKADARGHIFGYAICNDLSARDTQAAEMRMPLGPAKGKDFDGGNVLGPWIVTADEVDPSNLTGSVRVDGEEWGRSSSSAMHHKFEDMIEYVSRAETIHPGEIFLSGCFANCSATELGRTIDRPVMLELAIDGLGVLRNRII